MKTFWLALFIVFFNLVANCQLCTNSGRFTNTPFFSDSQISEQLNVTFASALDWKGVNTVLKLDVYYPTLAVDTMPLRPLIIMVHGGGLVSGDKINYTRVCKEFAKRGFVAATINYRLGLNCNTDTIAEEKAKYRAQQDVRAAFRFAADNAAALRIDTGWMFIGGGSAGSVAALGVVYLTQAEWNSFTPSLESLLGGLNSSGNNLTNPFTIKGVFNDWGAMFKNSVQPDEMIPMVSFHGDADSTVAIDSSFGGGCIKFDKSYGSRALHNLLVSNGICGDLSVKPGGGHGVYQDSIFGVPFRVGRAACFFRSLFCNSCTSFYQEDSVTANCLATTATGANIYASAAGMYPNPFQDRVSLYGVPVNSAVLLTNAMGRVVYRGTAIEKQDFSALPKGLYFLQLEGRQVGGVFKVIKN